MNLTALAASIHADADILRRYREMGNAAAVAREMGLSQSYVLRRVGPKKRKDGKRYCCRCGLMLEGEPHYSTCGACAWGWAEACPAHCLQHRGMSEGGDVRGVCGGNHKGEGDSMSNMIDELAQSLENVLAALEAYDKEQPVQTRLSRQHDAMAYAVLKARESLAVYRVRMLDGEPSPTYVTADYPEQVTL